MKALPFIRQPAEPKQAFVEVGDDRVGVLRIPCYGYLTADEADLIAELDPKNAVYVATCQAAVGLAKAAGIGSVEAKHALTRIQSAALGMRVDLTVEEQRLQVEHWELIAPLLQLIVDSARALNRRRCTAMVRRLEDCADWGDSDSSGLPGPLRDAIVAIALDEEAAMGGHGSPEEQLRQLEEDLGKQPPALSKRRDPTGAKRSGSSEPSTPKTRTRRASGSAASPSRTSSRRSTAASAANGRNSTGAS